MKNSRRFYIEGSWVDASDTPLRPIINPATEAYSGDLAVAGVGDVDRAVAAARKAFSRWAATSPAHRLECLKRILAGYQARYAEVAQAITLEMGSPASVSETAQAGVGVAHLNILIDALATFVFEEDHGAYTLRHEPMGVCGLITPWNWPINQVAVKVLPALAAGCTIVLKPSELSPYSADLWTEILDEAGLPPGVFNMIHGDGPTTGAALAAHPDVDMVSFTGSTAVGIEIARLAAPTIKRVAQELGGKSACVVLPDADLDAAVTSTAHALFYNSGQSCNAPSRILVRRDQLAAAAEIAGRVADGLVVGDPTSPDVQIGPVVSERQFGRIQALIETALAEGAVLVAGGPGRPEGLEKGWFVRPTVLSDVANLSTIGQQEVFGPVLSLIAYEDEEDAVRLANESPYGLSGYVWGGDLGKARLVANRIRAGLVQINGAPITMTEPFGGYKQSGNGREWGVYGLREYLETKAIVEPGQAA